MPINLLVFAFYFIGYLDTLTWKINLWGNQSVLGCLYCTIECGILLVKLALAARLKMQAFLFFFSFRVCVLKGLTVPGIPSGNRGNWDKYRDVTYS